MTPHTWLGVIAIVAGLAAYGAYLNNDGGASEQIDAGVHLSDMADHVAGGYAQFIGGIYYGEDDGGARCAKLQGFNAEDPAASTGWSKTCFEVYGETYPAPAGGSGAADPDAAGAGYCDVDAMVEIYPTPDAFLIDAVWGAQDCTLAGDEFAQIVQAHMDGVLPAATEPTGRTKQVCTGGAAHLAIPPHCKTVEIRKPPYDRTGPCSISGILGAYDGPAELYAAVQSGAVYCPAWPPAIAQMLDAAASGQKPIWYGGPP